MALCVNDWVLAVGADERTSRGNACEVMMQALASGRASTDRNSHGGVAHVWQLCVGMCFGERGGMGRCAAAGQPFTNLNHPQLRFRMEGDDGAVQQRCHRVCRAVHEVEACPDMTREACCVCCV